MFVSFNQFDKIIIYFLFVLYFVLKILTISISNLNKEYGYLNDFLYLFIFINCYYAIKYCKFITYEKLFLFFIIPLITSLIFDINLRAFFSLMMLILMMPIYYIFIYNVKIKYANLLLVLLFIILFINFYHSDYFGSIFWGYYGRERLNLGFFHPKEQCYFLIYLYIFIELFVFRKIILLFLYLLIFILIYLSDTRGSLVGFCIFGFFSLSITKKLLNKYYYKSLMFSILIIIVGLSLFKFEEINSISSNRLLIWTDILNERRIYTDSIDSSFLHFAANNLIGLYLISSWVIYSLLVVKKYFFHNIEYFLLIMTLGLFDVGLFSATNLIALHCWTIVLLGNPKNRLNITNTYS
jgi:hypothetical protein